MLSRDSDLSPGTHKSVLLLFLRSYQWQKIFGYFSSLKSYNAHMRKALIILAQNGYQDHEYEGTRKGLEDAGFEMVIAAKEQEACRGKFDGKVEADIALRDVQITDYDRVAFIGGPGAAAYASDADALKVANDAYRADMPLGAICIAPTILAKAHILDGKRATVWNPSTSSGQVSTEPTPSQILETYGAQYTGEEVTVDGKIVTGNGPDVAEEFGRTLASL